MCSYPRLLGCLTSVWHCLVSEVCNFLTVQLQCYVLQLCKLYLVQPERLPLLAGPVGPLRRAQQG